MLCHSHPIHTLSHHTGTSTQLTYYAPNIQNIVRWCRARPVKTTDVEFRLENVLSSRGRFERPQLFHKCQSLQFTVSGDVTRCRHFALEKEYCLRKIATVKQTRDSAPPTYCIDRPKQQQSRANIHLPEAHVFKITGMLQPQLRCRDRTPWGHKHYPVRSATPMKCVGLHRMCPYHNLPTSHQMRIWLSALCLQTNRHTHTYLPVDRPRNSNT